MPRAGTAATITAVTPSLRYDAEASLLADGRGEAACGDERIVFDASSDPCALPCPEHLLAAAFAGCLLTNLERTATFLRFRYERASVHVVAERHPSSRRLSRVEYELRLATGEPPGRVELLHRDLVRSGPVTSTVAAACTVSGSVAVDSPVPA